MGGILILRLSAIGDVAMTVHAVRALRAAYPDLPITIGTRERLSGFFNDVPNVQFLYFPKQAGFRELRSKQKPYAPILNFHDKKATVTLYYFHQLPFFSLCVIPTVVE